MFPSGKGATDSCTVGGSDVVNIDVVDAEMNESGDMVEGKQETKIATNGSSNGDNANTEEIKQDESESGKVPRRSDGTSDSTSIRTEHSSLPLHRCMRIVPHDQNSGGFFIAVLQKLSPLNGTFFIHLFHMFKSLLHHIS
jgi:multisite-specific tRNA:(cytosine-C5)-methyltransferase